MTELYLIKKLSILADNPKVKATIYQATQIETNAQIRFTIKKNIKTGAKMAYQESTAPRIERKLSGDVFDMPRPNRSIAHFMPGKRQGFKKFIANLIFRSMQG